MSHQPQRRHRAAALLACRTAHCRTPAAPTPPVRPGQRLQIDGLVGVDRGRLTNPGQVDVHVPSRALSPPARPQENGLLALAAIASRRATWTSAAASTRPR